PELLAVLRGDGKPALNGRNGGHVSNAPLGPQALRLPLARLNELGARDTVGETVMVLDPRPAGLSLVIVANQRVESRLREKDCRPAAGGDDHYHLHVIRCTSPPLPSLSRARVRETRLTLAKALARAVPSMALSLPYPAVPAGDDSRSARRNRSPSWPKSEAM